jgi:ASC-1-like (ASCH) protein
MLDYETHQEIYQKIGYNEIDVKMLSTWHSADDEVFSKENLQEIIRNKVPKEYSFENIKQSLREMYNNVLKKNYLFYAILFLLWMWWEEKFASLSRKKATIES